MEPMYHHTVQYHYGPALRKQKEKEEEIKGKKIKDKKKERRKKENKNKNKQTPKPRPKRKLYPEIAQKRWEAHPSSTSPGSVALLPLFHHPCPSFEQYLKSVGATLVQQRHRNITARQHSGNTVNILSISSQPTLLTNCTG